MATTPAPLDRQQQHLREMQQRRQMHQRAMMVPGPDNYAAHAQPRTMSSRIFNNGGMAKPLIWATPFQQLTSQLFDRIFDHLRQTHIHSLQGVLHVSRALRETAMPAVYRALEPNRQLLDDLLHGNQERILHHVGRFTRGLIARSNLNLDGVRRILQRANQWIALAFRHVQDASSLTSAAAVNIDLRALLDAPDTEQQPSDTLPYLQIDHIQHRGPRLLALPKTARRPAPHRLSIESYDWHHTPAEARRYFDLSHLEDLRLRDVPVARFLQSVNMADLAGVAHLELADAEGGDERAAVLVGELVQDHVRSLSTLDFRSSLTSFDAASLMGHASSLMTLRLRGGTLAQKQINVLADTLHNVTELELDLDAAGPAQGHLLAAMTRFQSLQRLTLHVPVTAAGDDEDVRRQQAHGILSNGLWCMFCAGKDASPLQQLTVCVGIQTFLFKRRGSTFNLVGEDNVEQVVEDVHSFFEDSSDWDMASSSLEDYLGGLELILQQAELDLAALVEQVEEAEDEDEMMR